MVALHGSVSGLERGRSEGDGDSRGRELCLPRERAGGPSRAVRVRGRGGRTAGSPLCPECPRAQGGLRALASRLLHAASLNVRAGSGGHVPPCGTLTAPSQVQVPRAYDTRFALSRPRTSENRVVLRTWSLALPFGVCQSLRQRGALCHQLGVCEWGGPESPGAVTTRPSGLSLGARPQVTRCLRRGPRWAARGMPSSRPPSSPC